MKLFRKTPPFNPVLTFPEKVQDRVRQEYAAATQILEYGSGGSTVLAAGLGKPVVAIESDRAWSEEMNGFLAANFPGAPAKVIHSDIGRTKSWGKPRNTKGLLEYHKYPLAIWDAPDFVAPDLILIDGRFRAACFCAAVLRISQATRVLFDDFFGRAEYALVERLAKPVDQIDRMAIFDLQPGQDCREELTWMIGSFVQPR
jgi:hypothetical protein